MTISQIDPAAIAYKHDANFNYLANHIEAIIIDSDDSTEAAIRIAELTEEVRKRHAHAAAQLCGIYFDIAANLIGEDEVRVRRELLINDIGNKL